MIFYIHFCPCHIFPLFLLSTKLIFLLIDIILYLHSHFIFLNLMRNKGTSVLFELEYHNQIII